VLQGLQRAVVRAAPRDAMRAAATNRSDDDGKKAHRRKKK
jgi:hypothetical protein